MVDLRPELKNFLHQLPISVGSVLLIIFYTIGFIGIGFSENPYFAYLTPINLLVSLLILLLYHPVWMRQSILFLLICYAVGFGVEVVGVNTGLLFGSYEYGSVLGSKFWNTPLIIGVNWILLVYSTGMTSNYFLRTLKPILKTAIGATIMVVLDFFIEPVAIDLEFWTWENNIIPVQNYLMWWLVSFILLYLFHTWLFQLQNKVARTLLALQFCFFGGLNLLMLLR
jgi:putative membrane protein